MAQHDYVIDNSTGANVRADINNVLQAIATNNSGSSDPSTTLASQFFADTSAGIMKLRNTANSGYVNLFTLAGGIDVDAASNFNEDVTFDGASADIVFDKSASAFDFKDNAKAFFGTGDDMEIFHDGSSSRIQSPAHSLIIKGKGITLFNEGTAEKYIECVEDGAIKLHFSGSTDAKFETKSTGAAITGTLDVGAIDSTVAGADNELKVETTSSGDPRLNLAAAGSGGHHIEYIRSSNTLNFKQAGGSVRLSIDATGHLLPGTDSQYNIGSSSVRFANVYADTLYGDGSNLTGITGTATTINNNADNRVITGSGTANTLEAEASLLFASGILTVDDTGGTAGKGKLQFGNSGHMFIEGQDTGNHGSGAYLRFGAASEFMRLQASTGALMIGDDGSTAIGSPKLHVLHGGAHKNVASFFFNTTDDRQAVFIRHNGADGANNRTLLSLLNADGNAVGNIISNGSSTSYNTSSDYRLKENEVAISDGITRLKTLKPYRFNFKADASTTLDGFFAHEVVSAVPEAIKGTKDETEDILYTEEDTIPSGKKVGDVKETVPKYQGIDQAKLVPLLVAAVQELITKVEVLEAA